MTKYSHTFHAFLPIRRSGDDFREFGLVTSELDFSPESARLKSKSVPSYDEANPVIRLAYVRIVVSEVDQTV